MSKFIRIIPHNGEKVHLVQLIGNGYTGHCITHAEDVTENKKCSEFHMNNAMWNDLWRMCLRILPNQR